MISLELRIREELGMQNKDKGEFVMVYITIAACIIFGLAVWKFIDIIIYVTNLATK